MSATTGARRPRRSRAAIAAALALGASMLTACGGGVGGTGNTAGGGTLAVALPIKPQSLDPGKNGNGGQNIVQWLAYEPLIRLNSDGSFGPGLATQWGYVGEGNKLFQMTIRTDAKFADGTPVTADSVAATINHYIQNPGPLSHYMFGVTKATAKDDQTVTVELDKPNPILPIVFSQAANWGDVISPAGLKNPEKLTSEMFGAGPYTLDPAQTVNGDHYTFVPNRNYYNQAAIHWNKVVARVLPDANSALQALRSGQVQVDMNAQGNIIEQARSSGVDITQGPGFAQAVFLLDRAGEVTPALGKLEVRQALNYAIDRQAIAKALGGEFQPTAQIAPAGTDGYDESLNDAYPYNPEKARRLLADAGYPDGFSFTLLSTSIFQTDTVSQAVADQLGKIGVKVDIKSAGVDLNQLIADMASKKYSAVAFNTGTDMFTNALQNFASPASPLNPFASQGEQVLGAFNALAAAPADGQQRAAVALNTAVTQNAWFVPIAQTKAFTFTKGIRNAGTVGNAGILDVLTWQPAS